MLHRLTVSAWVPEFSYPVLNHVFLGETQAQICALFEAHLAADAMLQDFAARGALTCCWDCCALCDGVPGLRPTPTPPGGGPLPPGGRRPGGGGRRPDAELLPTPPRGSGRRPDAELLPAPLPMPGRRPHAELLPSPAPGIQAPGGGRRPHAELLPTPRPTSGGGRRPFATADAGRQFVRRGFQPPTIY